VGKPLVFEEAFPAAEGRPLRPLVAPEFTTSWWRQAHRKGLTLGPVHALGAWAARDVTVAGLQNHLFVAGAHFAHDSVVPPYVAQLIAQGAVTPGDDLNLDEQVIEEPAVVFMGWGQEIYGHALVEMAPKIKIAARALKRAPEELRFVLPNQAPDWFRELMALAGARSFIAYDQAKTRLLLRRAWVVTLPVAEALHPACKQLFAEMRPPASQGAAEAIFITRRHAGITRPITLLNAEGIERRAEQAGLRVVSPEHMSMAEQARLFARARVVVGEYGSAMMNAVFCMPGAVVGAIGDRSQMLSAISAACELRQSFLDPLNDPHDADGYSVDPDAFSQWLDALLGARAERVSG
jgi:capsular polysaccharide biosynthesis protein